MIKCRFCLNPATINLYNTAVCDKCREDICYICSEKTQGVIFKNSCVSHEIGVPFKGNRFMEDKAFTAGGPFEFEPQ